MEQEKRSKVNPTQSMRDAMKKATTEMLVLFMLRQKPMYTYQMPQEVSRLTQGVLTYNTMYLAVYRLQDGRARIYLGITSSGQCYYDQLRTEYKLFTATLETLMNMDGHLYAEGKNG